jgi:hypothetical protein
MKKITLLLPFFAFMYILVSAQNKNRYRINGVALDVSFIPSKFNTKASSSIFNTTTKSETKLATDLLATVSLYYSPKLNLLATGGLQWHTIESNTEPFKNKIVTNMSLKLGAGIEYKLWEKNQSALLTQGLYMFEVIRKKNSSLLRDEFTTGQPVVTLVDYYPGIDNWGTRHAAELKFLYRYSINQSTQVRVGCGLSFELSDQYAKKAYYQGPPNFYSLMLSNATFSTNRESYLLLQAGVIKNISRRVKKINPGT